MLSCDVQGCESILVLECWVASALQEKVDHIKHVFFYCSMHWSIPTDLLIFLNIGIGLEFQQGLDHCYILCFHSEMQRGLPIDVPSIHVHLLVFQHRDGVMDVVMSDTMKQNIRSLLLYFTNHK